MNQAWVTILESLISAGSAIAVCIINGNAQNKKMLAELDKHDTLQAYRLDQLEKKVDKHNSVIERTYELERKADVIDEKMKVANHRLDDLERRGA